jgi:L-fuconolactonase
MESLQLLANAGIPYEVVGVLPAHLETALKVQEQVPGLRLVLDHLNQPPIHQKEKFGRWAELMNEIAGHQNVFVKISGLGTTTGKGHNWNEKDIEPAIEFVLEKFGVERCFCGGDWPVSLLAGSYEHAWKTYRKTLSNLLTLQAMEKVLYHNAKRFYQL